jgi:hypothetical protein
MKREVKKALPERETKRGFYLKGNMQVRSALPKQDTAKPKRKSGTVKRALSK